LELYVLAIGKFRPSQTVCVIAPSRKIDQYSYHYKKMLKRRILDKRKELTDDLHLITEGGGQVTSAMKWWHYCIIGAVVAAIAVGAVDEFLKTYSNLCSVMCH
jgi:hypothetical protein